MKKLCIGNVTLENNTILAPMAGVTDLPFRLLCKEQGAGLLCMEMVSAKAIYYNNKNTEELLTIDPAECPVSLQFFGSDPKIMSEMAKRIEDRPFALLDINMGCPVPKVVNNKEGSALMKDPKLVEKIVTEMVKAIHKPVTVKIRRGFSEKNQNAVEIAKIAEACGASAVAVHGRTREQYYSGEADWNCIREVKEAIKIPVIGNGDVTSGPSAKRLMDETGCDGIMIARAARGNPWIFREILYYLEHGKEGGFPIPSEKRDVIMRHIKMLAAFKGEYTAVREMRKHLSWYTAGMPGSARIREHVNAIESMEEMDKYLDTLLQNTV